MPTNPINKEFVGFSFFRVTINKMTIFSSVLLKSIFIDKIKTIIRKVNSQQNID